MNCAKYILIWLQKLGAINLQSFPKPWQNRLQSVYVFLVSNFMLIFTSSHMYSTLSRAVRFLPEFCQKLLEDSCNILLLYSTLIFCLRYKRFNKLIDFMEKYLSKSYSEINVKCARKCLGVFLFCFAIVFVAILGCIVEAQIPISESELEIRRFVYRTNYPGRRLPFDIRVPWVDETKSWAHKILYFLLSYIMFNYIFWTSLIVSMLPIIVIDIQGQYEILCKYVAMIGTEHRDTEGYRIYYTSIERNEYIIKMYTMRKRRGKDRMELMYEREFLRQIIQFHNKLLFFVRELISTITPLIYCAFLANNIIISLCLYQIVVNSSQLSPLRYFKFLAELMAVLTEYFVLCNSSEMVDDFHALLRQELVKCHWHSCTNETKKDLIMLIRRAQRANYLKFYNGALVLNRILFLKVINVAYTFVNFMRLRARHN